ncbi:MAG: YlbF family regulator [Bacillota bacterium]
MSVYDHAHALARAIKGSPEFRNFLKVKEKLDQDKSAKEMLADFRKVQWELQKQKLAGLEIAPEQEKRLSQLLEIIGLNLLVKEFLETEYRFSIMVADIQKIIGDAMEPLLSAEWIADLGDQSPAAAPAGEENQAATKQNEF